MSSFQHILDTYPDSLEARIIRRFLPFQAKITKISSELRASASPPPEAQFRKYSHPENFESILRFGYRKKLPFFVCFSLACSSWWFEDQDLGKIVRFLLEEEVDRFPDYGAELQVVLHSKAECLLFLQEKYSYNNYNDLFSSILTLKWSWVDPHTGRNISRTFFEIAPKYFWMKKQKPKTVQRKRGYRDHGSLGDPGNFARRQEWQKDYSSTEEQMEIEKGRRERRNLFKYLLGFFQ